MKKILFLLLALLTSNMRAAIPAFNFPQAYGAKGDGVTDDTTAFQTAINKRGNIYVPWTTNGYKLGSLVITNDTRISGLGGKPRLIFDWAATGFLLDCRSNVNVAITSVELDGQSNVTFQAISSAGSRSGIRLYSYGNYQLTDVDVHGFDNRGIFVDAPYATSSTGTTLSNNNTTIGLSKIAFCFTGLEYGDSSAEYQVVNGLTIRQCYTGAKILSGNINLGLCTITRNHFGVYLSGTNNNSHGNCSTSLINHNDYPIYATNVTYGFNFIGDQIWQGNVVLHTCTAVQIARGTLDVDALAITNGSMNRVQENFSNGSYGNAYSLSGTGVHFVDTNWRNGTNAYTTQSKITQVAPPLSFLPGYSLYSNGTNGEWGHWHWMIDDEFLGDENTSGSVGREAWRTGNSAGGQLPTKAGEEGAIGIFETVVTNVNDRASIALLNTTGSAVITTNTEMWFVIRIRSTSTNSATDGATGDGIYVHVGLNNSTTQGGRGIYFRYTTNSAQWELITASATATAQTNNVGLVSGGWQTLAYHYDGKTNCVAYIGTSESDLAPTATNTVNFPALAVTPVVSLIKVLGATVRMTNDVDYFRMAIRVP
jgi:hypothetical protein